MSSRVRPCGFARGGGRKKDQVVRLGCKPIEFEKRKAGVVAGSMEKLPEVIDVRIGAVRADELDSMLEQVRIARSAPKKKAA
ncbi:MAG: hypothetical protein WA733_15150 [Methylocystis sp.]